MSFFFPWEDAISWANKYLAVQILGNFEYALLLSKVIYALKKLF